ncbi:MAG: antibiotic biosynthesis monooxygenase [Chloroflexi bacterium]|nr:antibiotic biosynthesis monooxygenase [Chloroflexota bacterium]
MIIAYVSVNTKENAESEFERIIREIQADVLTMPGCVKNEWFRHPDTPGKFVMYGEFDTHDNFEAYQQSDTVNRIRAELMPLLAAPPVFKHYHATILDEG